MEKENIMKLTEVEDFQTDQVFLDLDGVLADFDAKVIELTGRTANDLGHGMWKFLADVHVKPGSVRHDILTLASKQKVNSIDELGFPKGQGAKPVNLLVKEKLLTVDKIPNAGLRYFITDTGKAALADLDAGNAYQAGPDFYNSLAKLPDADQLFYGVKNPIICTGKPVGNWAEPQKREWVAREYSPSVDVIVCMARDKGVFAAKKVSNDGRLHGAILIDDRNSNRSPWESLGGRFILHTSSSDSLAKLEALLNVEDEVEPAK